MTPNKLKSNDVGKEKRIISEVRDTQSAANDDIGEDYDEYDDDDYDPSKKPENTEPEDDSDSDNEPEPDYSAIESGVSQVRTRGQRMKDAGSSSKSGALLPNGLVEDHLRIDVAKIFEQINSSNADDWRNHILGDSGPTEKINKVEPAAEEKIQIFTTYTFAGKLVREMKEVSVSSAEAKAYMNSTNGILGAQEHDRPHKSYVTVMRTVAGSDEQRELRIKLKRPSLIDKFLAGDKKNKLTTLEKSRLDWASFVDKKRLKDDLATHNKGGYLDKQDFLGRMEAKRDTHYMQARDLERQRLWQEQQKKQ